MKKETFLLALLMTILGLNTTVGQANKKESYSVNFGPELLFPESDFRETHKNGFGASVKGEYTFGKHLSTTLNTGFSVFQGKRKPGNVLNTPLNYASLVAVPVKVGARYYVGSFYVQGEGGIVLASKFVRSTNGLLSIGLGDKIRVGGNKIDISVRQETWFARPRNFNMAVIRVAYEIVW